MWIEGSACVDGGQGTYLLGESAVESSAGTQGITVGSPNHCLQVVFLFSSGSPEKNSLISFGE
jgi:hypothetical protein